MDLGSRKQVSAIATQGRYSSSDWTTQYRLLYSDTGRNWKPYHQDGNIWVSGQVIFVRVSECECEIRKCKLRPLKVCILWLTLAFGAACLFWLTSQLP